MRFAPSTFGQIVDHRTGECWKTTRLESEISDRVAALAEAGVAAGDRVVLSHGGTPAFFADLFAVWQAGGCAVCLNPGLTTDELNRVSAFVSPRATVSAAGISRQECPAAERQDVVTGASLDDPALILLTSGTTGTPKGVVHTFRALLSRVALNQREIGLDTLRVTLCPLPTHFGHGLIGNCLTPLLAGCQLVLAPVTDVRAAATYGAAIDQYDATFMSSVPAFWRLVMKVSKPPSNGSLQRVHVGSAPLSARLWRAIANWSGAREVVNMYGITEAANWIAGASSAEFEPEDGLVGRVWGGGAAIYDEDGRLRATGEGEILLQTPSLMSGYFRLPDPTAVALRDGWFHTGDVGKIDTDGVIRLTGRKKFEINRGGIKVHPEDIDLLLERHEMVREACAFAIPDDIAGETVGVAVCVAEPDSFDLEGLKAWCAEHLAREKRPEKWFMLGEIPKNSNGKVDRKLVLAACMETRAQ